jgi:hypothetical protein
MEESKNNLTLLLFLAFLVIVSVFPQLYKTLFVQESGNITLIGLGTGIMLSVLIYTKWKYAKIFFYVIFVPVILMDVVILAMLENEFFFNFLVLSLCHLALLLAFTYSKKIKIHLSTTT